MNKTYIELAKARAELYRFLGGLYIMEVDADTLEKLKKVNFPADSADEEMNLAYQMIADEVARMTAADLDDLAADYAKTFLCAGSATGLAAFPYESIYTSKKHEIGGRTEQEVRALLLAHGWKPTEKMYRTMDDHIGLELEYMAVLCEEQVLAMNTENPDRTRTALRDQKNFMKQHLSWVTMFCMDANKYADTAFYQGVAKLTSAFMAQEKELLSLGSDVWVTE